MAYQNRVLVRFADVDYARVVYYPRYFDYCHRVFEDFFTDELKEPYVDVLAKRNIGFPSVHVEADYKAPLRFGDTARIVLETERVSPRSLTCRYSVFRGDSDVQCAVMKVITAAISVENFKGTEFPQDIQQIFLKHQVAA